MVATGRRRGDHLVGVLRERWLAAAAALLFAAVAGFWTATALRARPASETARAERAQSLAVPGIGRPVGIDRDRHGVPHIDAAGESDAFFALGFCQAQDRLAQLLHLRRRARGTAAEELGREAVEADHLARLLDFRGLADRQWEMRGQGTLVELFRRIVSGDVALGMASPAGCGGHGRSVIIQIAGLVRAA